MKLYTEEQVISMLGYDKDKPTTILKTILVRYKPIELPSDDDIRKQSFDASITPTSFQIGAHWVINHIKQQNNEDNNKISN
jgi:hypothetical protein